MNRREIMMRDYITLQDVHYKIMMRDVHYALGMARMNRKEIMMKDYITLQDVHYKIMMRYVHYALGMARMTRREIIMRDVHYTTRCTLQDYDEICTLRAGTGTNDSQRDCDERCTGDNTGD